MRRRLLIILGSVLFGVPLGLVTLWARTAFAQVDPVKPLAEGLGSNFLPYALAVCLVVIAFLAKHILDLYTRNATALDALTARKDAEIAKLREECATERAKLQGELITRLDASATRDREQLMLVIPLVGKLTEGLETIEQLGRE